jgi:hypothetical protein
MSKVLLCSNIKAKLEWREESFLNLFLIISFEFPWHKFTGGILDLSIDMQDT